MKPRVHYRWVLLGACFLALFFTMGARAAFGIFMEPLDDAFGWGMAAISLAMALSSLVYGLAQALTGHLADRYGPRLMMAVGLFLVGTGTALLSLTQSLWQLYLLYGAVTAIGMGAIATSNAALLSRWFLERRGLALSISLTGASVGQLILIPLASALILGPGWRLSYLVLGLPVLGLALPLALVLLRDNPPHPLPRAGVEPQVEAMASSPDPAPTSLRQVTRLRSFWLLALGYSFCGFTVMFALTHLAPLARHAQIGEAMAAQALALAGGVSVLGVLFTGLASDRVGRKNLLAVVWLLRGVGLLLLTQASSPALLFLAAVILGLSLLAPTALTMALAADLYGSRSVGTNFGALALGHQAGGALGAYLGGLIFDLSGSYLWALIVAGSLAFLGAGAGLSIKEGRPRVALAGAPA